MTNALAAAAVIIASVVNPDAGPSVKAAVARMPVCVQELVASRISHIVVGDPGYGYDGLTLSDGLVIVSDTAPERTLLHEFGHLDCIATQECLDPLFAMAVKQDFAAINPRPTDQLLYYRKPNEAWAEIFADRYEPGEGAPMHLLVRATALEDARLAAQEESCSH